MKTTGKNAGHSNPNCTCEVCLCGPNCAWALPASKRMGEAEASLFYFLSEE